MQITQAEFSHGASHNLIFILYYLFKIAGIGASAFAIYLGYRLFILGVTGQASLSVKSHDISGQLLNGAPGLFFAVGGIIALIISIWKGVKIDYSPESFSTRANM
jgi:hypothetical protein